MKVGCTGRYANIYLVRKAAVREVQYNHPVHLAGLYYNTTIYLLNSLHECTDVILYIIYYDVAERCHRSRHRNCEFDIADNTVIHKNIARQLECNIVEVIAGNDRVCQDGTALIRKIAHDETAYTFICHRYFNSRLSIADTDQRCGQRAGRQG